MPSIGHAELLDGSFHHHLLRDGARLDAFETAIRAVVKPGDVVADIGSGSGILAYFAARAGAAKVHAIELNTNSYSALVRNVRRNNLLGTVIPTLSDGTEWRPAEPVDVVVCELMETGLLHEPIHAIMQNVHDWPTSPRAIIPKQVDLWAEGVEVADDFRGYRATYAGFRGAAEHPALTTGSMYASYDFARDAPPGGVDVRFELVAERAGLLGGLQLKTLTHTIPGITLETSPAYCAPVVLTLDKPIPVVEGQRVAGSLAYEFVYTDEPLKFTLSAT